MGIPWIVQKIIDPLFQNKKCVKFGIANPYFIYPNYLSDKAIIYSAGAGGDISFEKEIVHKFGAKVFLFDPSPTGIKTMKNEGKIKNILFFKKAVAGKSGKLNLSLPKNKVEGSFRFDSAGEITFPCISISDFMRIKKHKKIDLFKMDIEGAEYEVLEDILNSKLQVIQICLEFHHYFKNIPYSKTIDAIKLLYKNNYKLIYKDIDNYTFIKKGIF